MNDRIDATLSQTDLDAILAAVETIQSKLPFLVDLSPDERQSLPKFGDKSLAFVQRTHEITRQDDSFLPRSFDVDAFGRDVALHARLSTIAVALGRLSEHVDDTQMQVWAPKPTPPPSTPTTPSSARARAPPSTAPPTTSPAASPVVAPQGLPTHHLSAPLSPPRPSASKVHRSTSKVQPRTFEGLRFMRTGPPMNL